MSKWVLDYCKLNTKMGNITTFCSRLGPYGQLCVTPMIDEQGLIDGYTVTHFFTGKRICYCGLVFKSVTGARKVTEQLEPIYNNWYDYFTTHKETPQIKEICKIFSQDSDLYYDIPIAVSEKLGL